MARLLVLMDDERHKDLKELALRNKSSMADLVRYAVEEGFEDDLDGIRVERQLEEAALDPSGTMSWEEFKSEIKAKRARTVSPGG